MIKVTDIEKTFRLYRTPADRLKELIYRRPFHKNFSAVKKLSFTVKPGETFGIIGRNGAGKSTLLKLLTGVLLPDRGTIEIRGKITGLLELGTGFNYEFSGRQNIFLNGTYLGLSQDEVREREAKIVAFSELEEFIQEPLKTYSSGMIMRLAFAIAIHADPEVFVIDEALSVGDAYFQHKCFDRIKEFKEQGGAIIFVSHDTNAVKLLCDRVMLLEKGGEIETGEPETVINSYNFLIARLSQGEQLVRQEEQEQTSYGNLRARIKQVELGSGDLNGVEILTSGSPATITVEIESREKLEDVTIGIMIRDKFGQDIFGCNSCLLSEQLELEPSQSRRCIFSFPELNLGPGKYSVTAALHTQETHLDECYHWLDKVTSFEVVHNAGYLFSGICRMRPTFLQEIR